MRQQSFHTRVLLSTFTVFLMLAGGCGSGGGGSHGDSPDGNSSDGVTQEKVISAINDISSLTNETIKGAFLGLPSDSEFSRTGGENITFNVAIVEESPDGSTAKVSVNREAQGTVGVDTNEDGIPEFKDVNISMTTHMKVQSEGEGIYSIIETSPTEIITTTQGLPDFKIKWVEILDEEGISLKEINSPDETFELDALPTLVTESKVTVKVGVEGASPDDIGVYLYHGKGKYRLMNLEEETGDYSLYAETYTVGQPGQYIGFVEVISKESLSDPDAPFQSRAWLIGYTVQ